MSHPSRPAIPAERPVPRVLVGAVMVVKSQTVMELGKVVAEEVQAAGFKLVRSVVVNGEGEFIQQLVSNVSNDNEADAIILVGGTGIGPKDTTCEAVEAVSQRGIEGFGDEAFRHMLREGPACAVPGRMASRGASGSGRTRGSRERRPASITSASSSR